MLKWLKSTGLSFQSTPDLINRENETFLIDAFANFMFQSTPDLINRENAGDSIQWMHLDVFQSTPDLINRENILKQPILGSNLTVSIHSRFN